MNHRVGKIARTGLFLALICVCGFSTVPFRSNFLQETTKLSQQREYSPLYLPEVQYVRLITLGHDSLFGDIFWFQTNSYFGRQLMAKKDFRWLGEMCSLVTALDPRAKYYFEFCGTLLSWVAKDPKASNKILDSAIANHPNEWRYHYLHGFNDWYFLQDRERAQAEFAKAAKLPDAPVLIASLASKLMVSGDDSEEAIVLLESLIRNSKDPTVRAALFDKLKRARLSHDFNTLRTAISIAEQRGQKIEKLDQLVSLGIIGSLPPDPFGGHYRLNPKTGAIETTSGEKGLDFSEHSYSKLEQKNNALNGEEAEKKEDQQTQPNGATNP